MIFGVNTYVVVVVGFQILNDKSCDLNFGLFPHRNESRQVCVHGNDLLSRDMLHHVKPWVPMSATALDFPPTAEIKRQL